MRVRRLRLVLAAYLLSVPFPAIILEMLGIVLPYEQAAFWLVALYMLPLWTVSELLGVPYVPAGALAYWTIVVAGLGALAYYRRRRSETSATDIS